MRARTIVFSNTAVRGRSPIRRQVMQARAVSQVPFASRRTLLDSALSAWQRAFFIARSHARPLVHWRVPIVRIRGRRPGTSREACVVVAGWKRSVEYFVRRYLGEETRRESLGTAPLIRLPGALSRVGGDADLIIARVPRPSAFWLFDSSYLRVPEGVGARVEVPENPDELSRASTRARRNINRIRRNELSWSISVDQDDFERFYRDYYVPFLSRRYGDLGTQFDRRRLASWFREGCILWIHKGDQRVAAALLQPEGPVLRWWVMGALTEGVDPAKTGALSAIYLFGVECARRYGFRRFDVGFSLPSLRDGVLSHKRSWGARLHDSPLVDLDLVFRWQRFDDGLADFLAETPLIFRDSGGLSAIAALSAEDGSNRVSAQKTHRKIAMPGLHRLYVMSRGAWASAVGGDTEAQADNLWLAEPGSSGSFRESAVPYGSNASEASNRKVPVGGSVESTRHA